MGRAPINTDNIDVNKIPEFLSARLVPFQRRVKRCPKCGTKTSRLPRWLLTLLGMYPTDFRVGYCPGGQDPEKEFPVVPGVISHKVTMPCAGIAEGHLHMKCMHCEHAFIMKAAS